MNSNLIWALVTVQMCLGLFDMLYHHEFTERLAWRASQRRELQYHAARNAIYALLFAAFGCRADFLRSPYWRCSPSRS